MAVAARFDNEHSIEGVPVEFLRQETDVVRGVVGAWDYHPIEALAVRIRFDTSSNQPDKLIIEDAVLSITAKRILD